MLTKTEVDKRIQEIKSASEHYAVCYRTYIESLTCGDDNHIADCRIAMINAYKKLNTMADETKKALTSCKKVVFREKFQSPPESEKVVVKEKDSPKKRAHRKTLSKRPKKELKSGRRFVQSGHSFIENGLKTIEEISMKAKKLYDG